MADPNHRLQSQFSTERNTDLDEQLYPELLPELRTKCKSLANSASHHSEYLIFMKSEFLLWHGTNWIEVKRTVYAEYYSSKPVAAEAAGR